jgi:hypothetical protein
MEPKALDILDAFLLVIIFANSSLRESEWKVNIYCTSDKFVYLLRSANVSGQRIAGHTSIPSIKILKIFKLSTFLYRKVKAAAENNDDCIVFQTTINAKTQEIPSPVHLSVSHSRFETYRLFKASTMDVS